MLTKISETFGFWKWLNDIMSPNLACDLFPEKEHHGYVHRDVQEFI